MLLGRRALVGSPQYPEIIASKGGANVRYPTEHDSTQDVRLGALHRKLLAQIRWRDGVYCSHSCGGFVIRYAVLECFNGIVVRIVTIRITRKQSRFSRILRLRSGRDPSASTTYIQPYVIDVEIDGSYRTVHVCCLSEALSVSQLRFLEPRQR